METAIDERVPAPTIALALFSRFASRQDESFAAKVNAALRQQFGGHAVQSADKPRVTRRRPAPYRRRVRGGDELRTVAEEHLDAVYAFLLYLTGDRAVAEDLTSETFERALGRWRRFDRAGGRRRRGCARSRVRGARPLPLGVAPQAAGGDVRGGTGRPPATPCSARACPRSWRRRSTACRPASAR